MDCDHGKSATSVTIRYTSSCREFHFFKAVEPRKHNIDWVAVNDATDLISCCHLQHAVCKLVCPLRQTCSFTRGRCCEGTSTCSVTTHKCLRAPSARMARHSSNGYFQGCFTGRTCQGTVTSCLLHRQLLGCVSRLV